MFFLVLKTSYCWCIFCTANFYFFNNFVGKWKNVYKLWVYLRIWWCFIVRREKKHLKECLNGFVCTPIDCHYCAWLWYDFLCKTLGVPAVMTQIQPSNKKKYSNQNIFILILHKKRKTNKQQHKWSREYILVYKSITFLWKFYVGARDE